jgi:hypothetical protein
MSNTRIWDALSKTDPKHTKPFKRSGGFQGTAIKPIWLTKRLTEHFGPAGTGWGMDEPKFQTVPAGEEILVFCTVALWYKTADATPLADSTRAIVYGVGGDKVMGKNKYGAFTNDEAFKASYTDALSNAMKQIGMGADIHMGQFEDEKYVRETAREFANGTANTPAENPLPEEDRHLLKNGETRSTYRVAADAKSPGRTNAEFWASSVLTLFNQPGYDLLQFREWRGTPCTNKGTKTNDDKLAELREKYPDLGQKIDDAVSNLKVAVSV